MTTEKKAFRASEEEIQLIKSLRDSKIDPKDVIRQCAGYFSAEEGTIKLPAKDAESE